MLKMSKKIATLFLAFCLIFQALVFSAQAAESANIVVSNTNPIVGDRITITCNFIMDRAIGSVDADVTYDSSILKCVSFPANTNLVNEGKLRIGWYDANNTTTTKSFAFTFDVIDDGRASFSFTGAEILSADVSVDATVESGCVITAIDKSTLPSDANIKSIKISQGTLSPSFSSSTTSYSVTVPNNVTKLIVTPTLSDSNATYAISGNSGLKVGTNTCVITVTAQNGGTKKYTIKITREADPNVDTPVVSEPDTPEVNPYEITINGSAWTLLSDYSLVSAPAGFTAGTRVINGVEMPVFFNEGSGTTIVYATNSDNTRSAYFIYNGDGNEYNEYKFFVTDANTYIILEPEKVEKVPRGFYYAETEVMGYNIGAYSYEDDAYADYVILYLETLDGNRNYYRYDMTDNSVQKATDFILALSAKDMTAAGGSNIIDNFMAADLNSQIAVSASALIVLLLIALIILTIVRISKNAKSRKAAEGVEAQEDVEELDFAAIIDGEEPTEAFDPNELEELKASEQEDDF